jgi:L-2,4-diaminobutyrate transaminase
MLENQLANDPTNYSLEDMDRHSLFHPLTSIATHLEKGPHIMARGHGVRCVIAAGER